MTPRPGPRAERAAALAQASASLSWDQWLAYLDQALPDTLLGLPRGLDLANPGDLDWLIQASEQVDRSGPSLPL